MSVFTRFGYKCRAESSSQGTMVLTKESKEVGVRTPLGPPRPWQVGEKVHIQRLSVKTLLPDRVEGTTVDGPEV